MLARQCFVSELPHFAFNHNHWQHTTEGSSWGEILPQFCTAGSSKIHLFLGEPRKLSQSDFLNTVAWCCWVCHSTGARLTHSKAVRGAQTAKTKQFSAGQTLQPGQDKAHTSVPAQGGEKLSVHCLLSPCQTDEKGMLLNHTQASYDWWYLTYELPSHRTGSKLLLVQRNMNKALKVGANNQKKKKG